MSDCILEHRDGKTRSSSRGLLCGWHYTHLEQVVAEMPALHVWLGGALGAGGAAGEKVDVSREGPAPIRVEVFDHRTDMVEKVASWVRLVTEERELHGPAETALDVTCPFLLAHLPWASEQPWVDEMAVELEALRRDGHRLAPWRPARYILPAPCPTVECGLFALVRYDGSEYVRCEACGRLWSEKDYEWLVLIAVNEWREQQEQEAAS